MVEKALSTIHKI